MLILSSDITLMFLNYIHLYKKIVPTHAKAHQTINSLIQFRQDVTNSRENQRRN